MHHLQVWVSDTCGISKRERLVEEEGKLYIYESMSWAVVDVHYSTS